MTKPCSPPLFATAINRMDGRVQQPVFRFLRRRCNVDYLDMITEAGPDKSLAENMESQAIASIRKRVDISVGIHGSTHIAIVGHHGCAGNPVDKQTHLSHIRSAVANLRLWCPQAAITGLWVDETWRVEVVDSHGAPDSQVASNSRTATSCRSEREE